MHPEFDYGRMIEGSFANASAASPPAVYFAKLPSIIRPLPRKASIRVYLLKSVPFYTVTEITVTLIGTLTRVEKFAYLPAYSLQAEFKFAHSTAGFTAVLSVIGTARTTSTAGSRRDRDH
jgi:hypothetical protein